MTSKFIVRNATAADLSAVVALLADDVLGATRERPENPLPRPYRDAFDAMSKQGGNHLLVACNHHGQVVGCLQLLILPHISLMGSSRAQIEGVRVAQSHRSQGLGQILFEEAIKRAQEAGCGMVQLTMNADRTDAKRFYESLGFKASHIGFKLSLNS